MTLRNTLLAAAAAAFISTAAFAAPIEAGSRMSFTGSAQSANGATSIDMATGLTFLSVSLENVSNTITGSFAGLFQEGGATDKLIQNIASFTDFTPLKSFYSFTSGSNAVSFDLNNLSVMTRLASNAGELPSLVISGGGTFHLTGFDDTAGTFTLTTQGSDITTFSASTVASATDVPEPASLALLGAGLLGMGLIRRRARQ